MLDKDCAKRALIINFKRIKVMYSLPKHFLIQSQVNYTYKFMT